jgi:hypothetical protein
MNINQIICNPFKGWNNGSMENYLHGKLFAWKIICMENYLI